MPRSPARAAQGVLAPNLTPLLDLVLQLITFFMMLVHFGSTIEGSTRQIRLPLAPAALPGGEMALDRLVVELDQQGRVLDGSGPLEARAAARWWAEQAGRRRAGLELLHAPAADVLPTVVILRADRDATFGALHQVLEQAQERGFAHFSLVVLSRRARS